MQLPEKYKENFDVSSEGPYSSNFPRKESVFLLLVLLAITEDIDYF